MNETAPSLPTVRLAASTVLLLLAAPSVSVADTSCSSLHPGRIANPHGNRLEILPESAGAPVEEEAIAKAVEMWTATCAEGLPAIGEDGNIPVRLRFHDGANDIDDCGTGCACTISNTLPGPDGGVFLQSSITHLFERYADGSGDCRSHRVETIAHEIGHVLGFRHPKDPYHRDCAGEIMSFWAPRSVRPADCTLARQVWDPVLTRGTGRPRKDENQVCETRFDSSSKTITVHASVK